MQHTEPQPGHLGRVLRSPRIAGCVAFIMATLFTLIATPRALAQAELPSVGVPPAKVAVLETVQLEVIPTTISVTPGEAFTLTLQVRSGAQPVDGAAAYLNFDPEKLQVEQILPAGALSLVLQNNFNNTTGQIDYAAGTFNSAPAGTFALAQIRFRAITSGAAELQFQTAAPRITDATYLGVSLTPATTNGTVTVLAPLPTVRFANATLTVLENAGSITTTVTLSAASAATATVQYSAGILGSGQLVFPPSVTSRNLVFPIVNDTLDEPDEVVNLVLSSPVNATLGAPAAATLTIKDNDVTPKLRFSSTAYTVTESAGQATILVYLGAKSGFTVTVNYQAGALAAGALLFPPGVTSRSFTAPIANDTLDEPNEVVPLLLSGPVNATLGTPATATLTILDNDVTPKVRFASTVYTVTEKAGFATVGVALGAKSGFTVTVNVQAGNLAAGPVIFAPGVTRQNFTVPIPNDGMDEKDETVPLTLSNPVNIGMGTPSTASLLITDDDQPPKVRFASTVYTVTENAGSIAINLRLGAKSGFTVTVRCQAGGLADGIVTFPPGATSRNFTMPITDDVVDEPDQVVALTLSSPTNATLGAPATAQLTIRDNDPPATASNEPDAPAAIEAANRVLLALVLNAPPASNDIQAPALQIASLQPEVLESAGFVTFAVTLDAPATQPVGVNYDVYREGVSVDAGLITFAPGETRREVPISLSNDTLSGPDTSLQIALANPVNALLGAQPAATITVVDDDALPTVGFKAREYIAQAAGGSTTIKVELSMPSHYIMTVSYIENTAAQTRDSANGGTSGTIVFAAGQTMQALLVNWAGQAPSADAVRTITLTAADHAVIGEIGQINLRLNSAAPANALYVPLASK